MCKNSIWCFENSYSEFRMAIYRIWIQFKSLSKYFNLNVYECDIGKKSGMPKYLMHFYQIYVVFLIKRWQKIEATENDDVPLYQQFRIWQFDVFAC